MFIQYSVALEASVSIKKEGNLEEREKKKKKKMEKMGGNEGEKQEDLAAYLALFLATGLACDRILLVRH